MVDDIMVEQEREQVEPAPPDAADEAAEEEAPVEEQAPDLHEEVQARVTELEATVAEREERLRLATKESSQLRTTLEEREAHLGRLNEEMSQVREQMATAVGKYRVALLAASPEVPEELVQGQTVAELDTALEQGRGMVERIRRQLETQAATGRVPAGAPVRGAPDLSGLSPREKIAYALGQR